MVVPLGVLRLMLVEVVGVQVPLVLMLQQVLQVQQEVMVQLIQ